MHNNGNERVRCQLATEQHRRARGLGSRVTDDVMRAGQGAAHVQEERCGLSHTIAGGTVGISKVTTPFNG